MTTFAKFGVFDKEAGLPGPVSGPSQGYPAGTPFRAVSGVPRQTPFRASRGVPRGYPARPRFRGSAGGVRGGTLRGVSGVPRGTPGGTPADPVSGGSAGGVRGGYPGGTPGVPRGYPRRTPVPGVGRGGRLGVGWGYPGGCSCSHGIVSLGWGVRTLGNVSLAGDLVECQIVPREVLN